jgi:hypothetical protein
MQEFVDDAITDPAQITDITRGLRRPLKLTRRQRWLIGAAVLLATLIIGILLGRFVL